MNKYRVLKPYPKQITNSGRLITLKKGKSVYLKKEAQVLRLVKMGFLKPVVEMPKKQVKPKKKIIKEHLKSEFKAENKAEDQDGDEKQSNSRRKSKSEYLNKKK